ncbi:hypothetical protein WA588_002840 [Blastocystis sp. NMH]
MKRLSHPNLVKLIDVVDDEKGDKLYMILEYIEKGQIMVCNQGTMTFYSPITKSYFDEDTARRYMHDIISGLKYLHLHKVVHRDIKPENLLLTNDDHVKIGDFGVAHLFETCSNAEQSIMSQLPETTKPLHLLTRTATGLLNNTEGTMYFYPPESTMEQPYNTYAADIWSVGVTFYVMVTGKLPIYNPDLMGFFDDLESKPITYPSFLSEPLVDLLKRFLCRDPTSRISIDEILAHPWMTAGGSVSSPSPSPVDRQTLTNAEIEGALSMRCHDSPMPSPRSSEVSSDMVYEDEEEDEALNETQKKKKKVFSMLAEQYAASKCTVY